MPEYVQVEQDVEPVSPPPYMDPANSKAKKKFIEKKLSMNDPRTPASPTSPKTPKNLKKCSHCGSYPAPHPQHMMIWPAPRPRDHIKPDNANFFGYVILIAIVIFLLFAACKYLP